LDDRLAGHSRSVGAQRGGRFGQRPHGPHIRGQPSVTQPLGELGELGAIGLDDEEDRPSVLRLNRGRFGNRDERAAGAYKRGRTLQDLPPDDVEHHIDLAGVLQARVRQAGKIGLTADALRVFCDSLCPEDEVAIEATCNTHAIVRLISPHVARVVVSNPQKTRAIAEAKVKTDKVDAAILAELLAADFLPSVWVADEATHALRRQVSRRANIVRQRTRLKNQVQAILQRNLIPRCPAADMFGVKGTLLAL
jgi:hypothetical protein